jgi:hypothetical protein
VIDSITDVQEAYYGFDTSDFPDPPSSGRVHHGGTSLAPLVAPAALLLGFEVQQLAGLQVTGISRFRD